MKIFTTGYTGKDILDLRPMLEIRRAILIDIRFAPNSRIIHWRKDYLKVLLGEKYRHFPNLGNRTYKDNKISIQNLKLGLETIISLDRNVVLMCVCETAANCHRREIVAELVRLGIDSEELPSWKLG